MSNLEHLRAAVREHRSDGEALHDLGLKLLEAGAREDAWLAFERSGELAIEAWTLQEELAQEASARLPQLIRTLLAHPLPGAAPAVLFTDGRQAPPEPWRVEAAWETARPALHDSPPGWVGTRFDLDGADAEDGVTHPPAGVALRGCRVGAAQIEALVGLGVVRALDLGDARLDAGGGRALAGLEHLESLALGECPVAVQAELPAIAARLPWLTRLRMVGWTGLRAPDLAPLRRTRLTAIELPGARGVQGALDALLPSSLDSADLRHTGAWLGGGDLAEAAGRWARPARVPDLIEEGVTHALPRSRWSSGRDADDLSELLVEGLVDTHECRAVEARLQASQRPALAALAALADLDLRVAGVTAASPWCWARPAKLLADDRAALGLSLHGDGEPNTQGRALTLASRLAGLRLMLLDHVSVPSGAVGELMALGSLTALDASVRLVGAGDALSLPRLERLRLAPGPGGDLSLWERLHAPGLQVLELWHLPVGAALLQDVAQRFPQLEALRLRGCTRQGDLGDGIAALSAIRHLDLAGLPVSNEERTTLGGLGADRLVLPEEDA